MLVQCRVYAFLQPGMQLDWLTFALVLEWLNNILRQVAVGWTRKCIEVCLLPGPLRLPGSKFLVLQVLLRRVWQALIRYYGSTKLPLELICW